MTFLRSNVKMLKSATAPHLLLGVSRKYVNVTRRVKPGAFSILNKTTSDGHALVLRGLVYFTICGIRQWNESAIRPGREVACPYCRMNAVIHDAKPRTGRPWPGGRPVSKVKRIVARRRAEEARHAHLRVA